MVKRYLVFVGLVPLVGCATAIDLGRAVCDTIVGGSRLGASCEYIDQLRDQREVAAEQAAEAAAEE